MVVAWNTGDWNHRLCVCRARIVELNVRALRGAALAIVAQQAAAQAAALAAGAGGNVLDANGNVVGSSFFGTK